MPICRRYLNQNHALVFDMIGKHKIPIIINTIVKWTPWYHSLWGGAEKFWSNPPSGLDVVNLGSGGAFHAFNYDGLGIKGVNWALCPQSLVDDFNILKNYFSFIKEGGTVILTACPFGFLFSANYELNHNRKYYTFLHPATVIGFDETERVKALTLRNNPFAAKPKRCIKEFLKYCKNKYFFPKHEMVSSCVDFSRSAKEFVDGWKRQFGITDLSMPLSDRHKYEYESRKKTLLEIIQFCLERGLSPVVVYPPIHPELKKLFPKSFEDITRSFMGGVVRMKLIS